MEALRPNTCAASGIMSRGKNAPMKNCSGTLIITAIEFAASSFFAIEDIISPIPIAESDPKNIAKMITGMFQYRFTWNRSTPLKSIMNPDMYTSAKFEMNLPINTIVGETGAITIRWNVPLVRSVAIVMDA